jgi:hypothetical protein
MMLLQKISKLNSCFKTSIFQKGSGLTNNQLFHLQWCDSTADYLIFVRHFSLIYFL